MKGERFVWNDESNVLILHSEFETEESLEKSKKKRRSIVRDEKIFCPHKKLILSFKKVLHPLEQEKFRKFHARKVTSEDDRIILQDIKDLVLYLLKSPVSSEFVKFFHRPLINRFLRALILYFQYFLLTWGELREKRDACAKKAPNPLAGGARLLRAEEMKALRCVVAREYADLLLGCQEENRAFHHAGAGKKAIAQFDTERDFRIFEPLLKLAHQVVWIALERKNYDLIEIELDRLFRTEAFNSARRSYRGPGEEVDLPKDEHWILYGPQMPSVKKIQKNSPLPYEIINTDCDYRLLNLGFNEGRVSQDPRIVYLERALIGDERTLREAGVRVGILGMLRSDYDVNLIAQKASEEEEKSLFESSRDSFRTGTNSEAEYESVIPPFGADSELDKDFLTDKLRLKFGGHRKGLTS